MRPKPTSTRIERCKQHRSYKGYGAPRSKCHVCWRIWYTRKRALAAVQG